MRVQLDKDELWPIYVDWHGFGTPEYDVEVPDEIFKEYERTLSDFIEALTKLKEFLNDN